MVLGERVVLFHDNPPQGPGNAEVMEEGLGLCPGLLPFPHARRRLALQEPLRVALLARRFTRFICVPMDEGTRLDWNRERWQMKVGVRRLTENGKVVKIAAR
jgi:hypothetical protein